MLGHSVIYGVSKRMKSRELTLATTALAFLVVNAFMLPMELFFFSELLYGFLLHFTSLKTTIKVIGVMTGIVLIRFSADLGIFAIPFALGYFFGAIAIFPFSYFLFKKWKIKERVGKGFQ